MNVHDTRCRSRWLVALTLALGAAACSTAPSARAPIAMVKIDPSPGGGGQAPALTKHADIKGTESANDPKSGPKVWEAPKEPAKEPRFAAADQHVGLSKHSSVPVGGNEHGFTP